jgi:CheY-like chemotaxis protein
VAMAGEKILSIDDSPTVQRLIEMILSSQGYQVVLASDGEEGIAKAKAEKPSVILVDFVMPKMNGFQVCKTLKDDPTFKDTPMILVTSKGDKVGSKFVDVLGIAEYFTKPFQPEDLLAKIREVIDKQGPGAAATPSPPRPAAAPAASAPAGIETVVRNVVGSVLEDFARNALPDIIRRELGKVQSAQNAGIRGNLATFRIIEVLQMLGLQRQTGRLVVTRGNDGGEIYFKEGDVVFATSSCGDGKPALEGLLKRSCRVPDQQASLVLRTIERTGEPVDAVLARERLIDPKGFSDCLRRHTEGEVFKIMAWRDGSFVFEKVAPPVFAAPVRLKVEDLLLEGARRSDEWLLIQQKIPNFGMVFEPLIADAAELTRRGMSPADVKVFSLVDGRRTVQEIIDTACLSDFDVAKSLFILLSVNLVRARK